MLSSTSIHPNWFEGFNVSHLSGNRSWTTLALISITIVLGSLWILRELRLLQKKLEYFKHGMEILHQKKDEYVDKPFQMTTNVGDTTILPPSYISVIRNNADLSLRKALDLDFHAHLPGFSTFSFVDHPSQVLQKVARKQLTQHPITTNGPLSEEAAFATDLILGNSDEWRDIRVNDAILDLVARLSSRVFLGPELCRNEAWHRVNREFRIAVFISSVKLNLLPPVLRPLFNWLDPSCRQIRAKIAETREILRPEFERRQHLKKDAQALGKSLPVFDDAIEWAQVDSHGTPYDAAIFQLTMSLVSIHTSGDLLCRTLLLLAEHPEYINALRKEITDVLKSEGLTKTALYNMKLLDSAIKETQRFSPIDTLTLRRVAQKDVILPDGTLIRKGERTYVRSCHMTDEKVYPNPERYDIFRFREMRELPGGETRAQLVTLTPDLVQFGYGIYACPGRFFAAHEIKVALCHLLLKYDWRIPGGGSFKPVVMGTSSSVDPEMNVEFRRRSAEVDLEALQTDEDVAFDFEDAAIPQDKLYMG